MDQTIKHFDTEKAVALLRRAAALFIRRAKRDTIDNLLLEKHYFRLDLADRPLALVVMCIRGKTAQIRRG